jgi:hypothetical protein
MKTMDVDQRNHQSMKRHNPCSHEGGNQKRIDFPFVPDKKMQCA